MEGDGIQGPDQGTDSCSKMGVEIELFELGSPLSLLFEIVHRDTVLGNSDGVR